jgi:hypothetical protein
MEGDFPWPLVHHRSRKGGQSLRPRFTLALLSRELHLRSFFLRCSMAESPLREKIKHDTGKLSWIALEDVAIGVLEYNKFAVLQKLAHSVTLTP